MLIETVLISFKIILSITYVNESGEEVWCVVTSGKLKRARIWRAKWLSVCTLLSIMKIDYVRIQEIYLPSCHVLR
jgi:hypothetical protein